MDIRVDRELRNRNQRRGGRAVPYSGYATVWATLTKDDRVQLAVQHNTWKGACRFTTLTNAKLKRDTSDLLAEFQKEKHQVNVLALAEGETNEPCLTRIEAELAGPDRDLRHAVMSWPSNWSRRIECHRLGPPRKSRIG